MSTGRAAPDLVMRMPRALFDVVDIVGDGVVVVDMADAGKPQFFMAGRALHGVAMDDPMQALVEIGAAFRAPDLDPVIFVFVFVRIGHVAVSAAITRPKRLMIGCRRGFPTAAKGVYDGP